MKRIALLLVIVLLLSMMLSSCQVLWMVTEPKNADELWERIDEKMDDLDSMRVDAELSIALEYMGVEIKSDAKMTIVTIGSEQEEDPYYYSYTVTETKVGGLTEEKSYDLTAYDDGKMYLYERSGSEYSRICSAISPKEFNDFYSDDDEFDFDISPEHAEIKNMEKSDDGEWEIMLSDFEENKLREMLEQLKLDELSEVYEIEINDISVKFVTDKKYMVKYMQIDFVGEVIEDPVFSMKATFSEYNSAEKVEFDKSEYTEVDDARVAKWLDDYLSDVIDEEKVEFTFKMTQRLKANGINNYNVDSSYTETDDVTFENRYDNFFYNIEADINGEKVSIEYEYGNQIINIDGEERKVSQSDSEARNFIESLMNSAEFETARVWNITKIGANRYKIELSIFDDDDYKQLMKEAGVGYESTTVFVEVEMDGEDVKAIKTTITVKGRNNYVTNTRPLYDCTYTLETYLNIVSD